MLRSTALFLLQSVELTGILSGMESIFSTEKKGFGLLIVVFSKSKTAPIESGIALGVIKATFPAGNRVELVPMDGDGIFRMRNQAANVVRADPNFAWVTHILMLDDDIVFAPEDVYALLQSGKDLISGCYPKRQDKLEYVVNLYPGDVFAPGTGPLRAACVGTGFVLISRNCLNAIAARLPRDGERVRDPRYSEQWFTMAHWFNPDDDTGKKWWFDYFPMAAILDPDSGFVRQLSEDWWFSKLALLAGIQPYIHTNVMLKHAGGKIFG